MAKRTDEQGRAYKKSQLQMQLYVNRREEALTAEVLKALPSLAELQPTLTWTSPIETQKFAEYHDLDFLNAIERPDLAEALADYWPSGGPHWDALAVARGADGKYLGPILVEAKSWPGEMRSKISAGEPSRKRIASRLGETRQRLGVSEDHATAWLERSYQAANRFSHLSWLLDVLGEDAWLVNIYFLHDPEQPTSRAEWDAALDVAEKDLGMESVTVPNSGRVFLEAGEREELLAAPAP
jgi:hypothetical protein